MMKILKFQIIDINYFQPGLNVQILEKKQKNNLILLFMIQEAKKHHPERYPFKK